MRHNYVKTVALGGMFSALSVVLMCLGTLVPVATYACPMLCMLAGLLVFMLCGKKIAWCWYVSVAILSLLLAPDKEAAAVFLLLGYYPIVKPWFERKKFGVIGKFLWFNAAIGILYTAMYFLIGMDGFSEVYQDFTFGLVAVLVFMGNLTFLILDKLLDVLPRRFMRTKQGKKHG